MGALRTANPTRIVSVIKNTPTTAGCPGTQSYSSSNTLSCSSSCLLGPTSGNDYCGTSLGPTTYCCYRPHLLWTASTNPTANPTNVAAYPFFSIPVTVRLAPILVRAHAVEATCSRLHQHDRPYGQDAASASNVCLTSTSFVSSDAATISCPTASQFEFGFVNDDDWCVTT